MMKTCLSPNFSLNTDRLTVALDANIHRTKVNKIFRKFHHFYSTVKRCERSNWDIMWLYWCKNSKHYDKDVEQPELMIQQRYDPDRDDLRYVHKVTGWKRLDLFKIN